MNKSAELTIRCTDAEKEEWTKAAEADGRTLSNWVRWNLNIKATKERIRAITGHLGRVDVRDVAGRPDGEFKVKEAVDE